MNIKPNKKELKLLNEINKSFETYNKWLNEAWIENITSDPIKAKELLRNNGCVYIISS